MQEKKSTQGLNLPDYQKIEGDYRHAFSYNQMDVKIMSKRSGKVQTVLGMIDPA